MARWRIPSNAIFRAGSSRGIRRLEYAPQHEWDPQRISAVAGMVGNINKAATGVLGARPLDLVTAGVARLVAPGEKKGTALQTGADIMRRAALARAKRDKAAAELKQMRAGAAPKPGTAPAPAPTEAPGSLIDPKRAAPPKPVGIQDLSKMSFGKARRYARSTLGHEKFKWRGGIYSTVGYEDRAKPRPQRKDFESDTDWQRALEAARKRRGAPPAPAPSPADPTTLYPRTGPEAAVGDFSALQQLPKGGRAALEGLTQLGQREALELLSRAPNIGEIVGGEGLERHGALVDIVKILSDPSHPSYGAVVEKIRHVSGPGEQYGTGQRVIDMLRPPTPAPAPTPTPTPTLLPGPSADPDVEAARKRQRERLSRIAQGLDPAVPSPAVRQQRIQSVGSALDAGRIFPPDELPTSVDDLASVAMVITERHALPALVRQARTHALPTTFADLFTGGHKRRAADRVMKAFLGGERARPTAMQRAALDQRERQFRQRGAQQHRKLELDRVKLLDKLRTSKSLRERRSIQNQLTRIKAQQAWLKYQRTLAKYKRRGKGVKRVSPEAGATIDALLKKYGHPSMAEIQDIEDPAERAAAAARARRLLASKTSGKWLTRRKVPAKALRVAISTLGTTSGIVKRAKVTRGLQEKREKAAAALKRATSNRRAAVKAGKRLKGLREQLLKLQAKPSHLRKPNHSLLIIALEGRIQRIEKNLVATKDALEEAKRRAGVAKTEWKRSLPKRKKRKKRKTKRAARPSPTPKTAPKSKPTKKRVRRQLDDPNF